MPEEKGGQKDADGQHKGGVLQGIPTQQKKRDDVCKAEFEARDRRKRRQSAFRRIDREGQGRIQAENSQFFHTHDAAPFTVRTKDGAGGQRPFFLIGYGVRAGVIGGAAGPEKDHESVRQAGDRNGGTADKSLSDAETVRTVGVDDADAAGTDFNAVDAAVLSPDIQRVGL